MVALSFTSRLSPENKQVSLEMQSVFSSDILKRKSLWKFVKCIPPLNAHICNFTHYHGIIRPSKVYPCCQVENPCRRVLHWFLFQSWMSLEHFSSIFNWTCWDSTTWPACIRILLLIPYTTLISRLLEISTLEYLNVVNVEYTWCKRRSRQQFCRVHTSFPLSVFNLQLCKWNLAFPWNS